MRSTISFGEYLQSNGISHGDIRPHQILLTEGPNDDGQIKLADNGLVGQFKNSYALSLTGAGRGYLSPSLLRACSKHEHQPEYNVYKEDVFSLGLTVLSAATLKDPNASLYDWKGKSFDDKNLELLLLELQGRYSSQFVNFLRTLLDEDEFRRPDFAGLNGHAHLSGVAAPQPHINYGSNRLGNVVSGGPVSGGLVSSGVIGGGVIGGGPIGPIGGSRVVSGGPIVGGGVVGGGVIGGGVIGGSQVIRGGFGPSQVIGGGVLPPPPPSHILQGSVAYGGNYQSSYGQPGGFVSGSTRLPQNRPPVYSSGYEGIKYVSQISPSKKFEDVEDLSDLDRRVQEAIKTTEETINRNSQIPNLVQTQAGPIERFEGHGSYFQGGSLSAPLKKVANSDDDQKVYVEPVSKEDQEEKAERVEII